MTPKVEKKEVLNVVTGRAKIRQAYEKKPNLHEESPHKQYKQLNKEEFFLEKRLKNEMKVKFNGSKFQTTEKQNWNQKNNTKKPHRYNETWRVPNIEFEG
ncbi:STX17 [Acrasis kona]